MKEESKVKQTNKAKQHSTPKAVKKLPRVGLEPTCTCTCTQTVLYLRAALLEDGGGGCGSGLVLVQLLLLLVHVSSERSGEPHQLCITHNTHVYT